jgi:hypothetical protein
VLDSTGRLGFSNKRLIFLENPVDIAPLGELAPDAVILD